VSAPQDLELVFSCGPDFIPSLLDLAARVGGPFLCCHWKLFDFGYHSSISLVLCVGLLQVRIGIVLELPD
jgi:hypothetical protein